MDQDFDFEVHGDTDDDHNFGDTNPDGDAFGDDGNGDVDEDELLVMRDFHNVVSDSDNELGNTNNYNNSRGYTRTMGQTHEEDEEELLVVTDDEARGRYDNRNDDDEDPDNEHGNNANSNQFINLDEVEFEDPPEHGIIVVGQILNAFDLNNYVPASSASSGLGKLFFKILFAAESSSGRGVVASSAFRCKTPMFTSASIPYSVNPSFDNSFFKFETTLPLVLSSAQPTSNTVYGEIIISLFYVNENGVQQAIGDVCFDLVDLSTNGSIIFVRQQLQVRGVDGHYPIISKSSSSAAAASPAELYVCMRVAWSEQDFRSNIHDLGAGLGKNRRSATSMGQSSVAGSSRADSRGRAGRPGSATASATANRPGSRGRTGGPGATTATVGSRSVDNHNTTALPGAGLDTKSRAAQTVAPTLAQQTTLTRNKSSKTVLTVDRPASHGGPMVVKRHHGGIGLDKSPVKRVVGSRIQEKMYFEQKKIDKENAAMLARMQKNGKVNTHTAMYESQAKKPVKPTDKDTVAAKSRDSRSRSPSPAASRVTTNTGIHSTASTRKSQQLSQPVDEKKLLDMYNNLKKVTSDMAQDNSSLKSRVNKLKLAINKYDTSLRKMKKQGIPDSVLAPTKDDATNRQAPQPQYKRDESKGAQSDPDDDNHDVDIDVNYESPAVTSKQKKKHGGGMVSDIEEDKDEDEFAAAVDIGSIQFVDTDYIFGVSIQDSDADAKNDNSVDQIIASFEDKELADMAEEYVILQNMRRSLLHRIKSAKQAMAVASKRAKALTKDAELVKDRLAVHLSLAGDETNSVSATSKKLPVNTQMENELAIKQQIIEVNADIVTMESLRQHDLTAGSLSHALLELRSVVTSQRQRYQQLRTEFDNVRYEKDMYLQKYSRYVNEDKAVVKLRESINVMRTRLGSLKRKERMKQYELASEAIEIELLRRDLGRTQDVQDVDKIIRNRNLQKTSIPEEGCGHDDENDEDNA
jgi:hypothetical protein